MPCVPRSGKFQATPTSWEVKSNPTTKSVGLVIHFAILAEQYFDDSGEEGWEGRWSTDWVGHTVSGYFNLITGKGKANTITVEQLAKCLDYRFHSFAALADGPPHGVVVELDVIPNARDRGDPFTIQYMNPIGGRQSDANLDELDAVFGAELRAASSEVSAPGAPPAQGGFNQRPEPERGPLPSPGPSQNAPKKNKKTQSAPGPLGAEPPDRDDDDLPF